MKITNNKGLPEPFVRAVSIVGSESDEKHTPQADRYSVTELLRPTRELILRRRHAGEITQDASEMVWSIFGTAVHKVMEDSVGEEGISEMGVERTVGKWTVYGYADYVTNDTVTDYKTTSVWKFRMGDFSDWKAQLETYAWMLQGTKPFDIKKGQIIAILRDHRKGEARSSTDYPAQVETVQFDLTDLSGVTERIVSKLSEVDSCEYMADEDLPMCSEEERWARSGGWAVMKKNRKSALRVLQTEEQAKQWKEEHGGDFIERRIPYSTKCEEYCSAAPWCSYYRELHKNDNGTPVEETY